MRTSAHHSRTSRYVAVLAAAALAATPLALVSGVPAAHAAMYQVSLWPATDVAEFDTAGARPIAATSDGAVYSTTDGTLDLTKYLPDGETVTLPLAYGAPNDLGPIAQVHDIDVDADDRLYLLVTHVAHADRLYVARLTDDVLLEDLGSVQGGVPALADRHHADLGVSGNGQHIVVSQSRRERGQSRAPATAHRYTLPHGTPEALPASPLGPWELIRGMDYTNDGDLWTLAAGLDGTELAWLYHLPAGASTWEAREVNQSTWGNLSVSADDVVAFTSRAGGSWAVHRLLLDDPRPWTVGRPTQVAVADLATTASVNGDVYASTGHGIVRYGKRTVEAPDLHVVAVAGEALAIELEPESGGQPGALQISIVDPPSHGTLVNTAPNHRYTADASFTGTDTFTYEAAVWSTKATGTVTIEVLPPGGHSYKNWRRVVVNQRANTQFAGSLANLGEETAYTLTADTPYPTHFADATELDIRGWRSDGSVERTPWTWSAAGTPGEPHWPVAMEGGPDGNLYAVSGVTSAPGSYDALVIQRFTPGDPLPETLWTINAPGVLPQLQRIGVGPDLSVYATLDGEPRRAAADPSMRVLRFVPGQTTPVELPTPANGWATVSNPEVAADGTVYVTGADGLYQDKNSRGGIWKLAPGASEWELILTYDVAAISWAEPSNPMHVMRNGLIAYSPDHLRINLLNPDSGDITTIGRVRKAANLTLALGDITSDPSGAIYAARARHLALYRFVPPKETVAQEITFPQPADLVYGGPEGELGASAPGGTVAYTSATPAVCTVAGSAVHPVAAGVCSITASQDGGPGYLPADPVTRTLTVAKAAQTITFPQPGDLTVGDDAIGLQATSTSGLPVALSTTSHDGCLLVGANLFPLAGGECVVTAVQGGDANHAAAEPVTRTVSVAKAAQTVTFAQPVSTVFGGADVPLSASASSGLPVTLTSQTPAVCAVVGGQAHPVAAGTCTITATQPGSASYLAAAAVTRSLAVAKAAQSVSFAQPGNTVFEGADVALTATASSGLSVTFTSQTPTVCTVVGGTAHPTGAGTCTITAAQAGDGNYLPAAAVTRSLTVAKAPIAVTTSSSSSLASLLTLRVNYASVVKSATTGKPVAGVTVTTRIDGGSPTSGCVGVTDANGVAKCTSGPIGIALLTSFTASAQESANYLGGVTSGRTPLL